MNALTPGQVFATYRVEEFVGKGGMGEVYRAHDLTLDRPVAIKLLTKPISEDTAWAELLQEARTVSALNHPNICTVYEAGEEDERGYICMEYVEGKTLNSLLPPEGFPPAIITKYGTQIAEALDYAHRRQIVHRDVKSHNIAITPDGRVKLLDFGLAQRIEPEVISRITTSHDSLAHLGPIAGTLPYLAPEVLCGKGATKQSDVWSLGVVLHEMSTGQMPFTGGTPFELSMSIMASKVVLPKHVPRGIRSVVEHCLERDLARRYESAGTIAERLHRSESARQFSPRRALLDRGLLVMAALSLAVLLALALAGLWSRRLRHVPVAAQPEPAPAPAQAITQGMGTGVRRRPSIAVLALRNSTGRPDAAWLSTALSEMLTSELAAGEQLRAIPGENVARMKLELSLGDLDSLDPATSTKIRSNLDSDYIILGSFTELGDKIRLDLRLEDAQKGAIIAAVGETGTEAGLFDVVSRAAARLRESLRVGVLPDAQLAAARSELPSDPAVAKLYADGLAKLRVFDAIGARPLLESAVAREPNFPLAHSALGADLSALGYDAKARDEAKKAFDLSATLNREEQLVIEGRYRRVANQWDRAQEVYHTLFALFPDNLDYGLSLLSAEMMTGKGNDVITALNVLRHFPAPANLDPRIDLAEAYWAESIPDFRREQQAATRALERSQVLGSVLLAARARLALSTALWKLGQPDAALAILRAAESTFASHGDRDGEAQAASGIAQVAQDRGNLAEARRGYERALKAWRAAGDERGVAGSLNNLGLLRWQQGDAEGARQLYSQALDEYRQIDDQAAAARTMSNVASVLYSEGQIAAARRMYEESAAKFGEVGDKDGLAEDYTNIGLVLTDQGDLAGARSKYEQAANIARELGTQSQLAEALEGLGEVSLEQGDLEGAGKWYAQALSVRHELGEKGTTAETQLDLAWLALERGRPADAQNLLAVPLGEFRKEGQADLEAYGEAALARALLGEGKQAEAEAAVERAHALADKAQSRGILLIVATIQARVEAASGNPRRIAAARRNLIEIESESVKLGFVDRQLEARLARAEIDVKGEDSQSAKASLTELEEQAQHLGFGLIAQKARQLIHSGRAS